MKLKRLSVATPRSSARMIAFCLIHRAPDSRPPLSCGAPGGSSASIFPRNSADQKNETASTPSAYGPRNTWTRTPPMLLPARNENARLP